jgi:hypothetical protein
LAGANGDISPTLSQPMFFFPYYDIENLKKLGFIFGNLGFLVQIQPFFFL